ncbi:hypothetical protein HMPREF9094_1777 [Fusobacterium animalis ATCC 51191]|uniref:Uncharacterized protein n=1 Tax=Fusobacterium animalis ATCC 51191 TaxID=997347 RepID=F9EPC2_9FUSO|nr:hypothetical protein HMPREF9094_1777 [Fusobacterium animalis ATCC 51191]
MRKKKKKINKNYKRDCCKLINEVKNSLLLAKFLNDEKFRM